MKTAVIPLHQVAANGLRLENTVLVRLLALCPMLAVSVNVSAAATLGALTLVIMSAAGGAVAALRGVVAEGVRLPVFLLIVAAFVAVADMAMEANAPDMYRRLGIFLPLIITNCAVLARLETFARRQSPLTAIIDGAAVGGGMLIAIVILAAVREILTTGGIAFLWNGTPILSSAALPAGGFILFGLLIAAARKLNLPTAP